MKIEINITRKHKIIAAAVLLVLGLMVVLNSVLARRSTLSASPTIKTKKSVKNVKPAARKVETAKEDKVSDDNQLPNKNSKIADNNQTSDSDLKLMAEIVKSSISSVPVDVNNSEIADDNNAFSGIQSPASDELASKEMPVKSDTLNSNGGMTAVVESEAKPEQASLSANLDMTRPNIQSLIFMRNMPITDALQLLAIRYGKNIVPATKITGNLAFTKLNNISFQEAMDAILGQAYEYQEEGNLIKIYSSGAASKVTTSSGMACKVFTLYYIRAAEARKMVAPVMSSSSKIEITSAAQTGIPSGDTIGSQSGGGDTIAINDMMVVYDYPENIAQIEKIIETIDVRPKQVLIEATILTATLTDGMQFGIDWRNLKGAVVSSLTSLATGSPDYFGFSGTSTNVESSLSGGMTIGIVKDDVAAFIKAVEEITDVTILANPKILTTNKQLGQVYIGTKLGYLSSTEQTDTSTTQAVSFLDTGTKLSFRPFIGNDGYIRIDIHPKDSSAAIRQIGGASSTIAVPDETSAELVSNVIVKDGETIVIGGLFRNKVQTAKTQVPLLGNLPVIGVAFSSTADKARREEVIVLITPHIIGDPRQADGDERAADVARIDRGSRKEIHPANRIRLAEEHYEKAAVYYAKGKNQEALKELNSAIELDPTYLEAIRLEEKIYNESGSKYRPIRKVVDDTRQPESSKWRRR